MAHFRNLRTDPERRRRRKEVPGSTLMRSCFGRNLNPDTSVRSLLWIIIWVCYSAFDSTSAQEVILHLRNGDRLSGAIISANTNEVIVSTSYAGRITIPAAQIERREDAPAKTARPASPQTPIVQTQPQPGSTPAKAPVPAKPSPPASSTTTNAGGFRAAEPIFALGADLRKLLAKWKGELEIGLNLVFGTKDRQTYAGRFRASHLHPIPGQRLLKNDLDYLVSYGKTDGILSENRMDGAWKLQYDIGKRFLMYNAAGAGYDEIRRIDLRYDVGPGVGYKWVTRTNVVLLTELGGNYQEQLFSNDGSKRRYSLRLGEESWWQVASKLRFDEKVEFFPEVDRFGQYRLRGEVNLSYLLRNNVAFKLTLIDLYESDPAVNVSKNDLQIRSSVGIKF